MTGVRHVLDVDDLGPGELAAVLDLAEIPAPPAVLAGRGVGLVFEKPSARTRNATELAVVQLGGHPVSMRGDELGMGTRETPEDVARVMAGYHAALGARVFDHTVLERMAAVDALPIVNLLSDRSHPCQALADLLTMRQHFGALEGRSLAWVGDGNNVARSVLLACALAGVEARLASPAGYGLPDHVIDRARSLGGTVHVCRRPEEAATGADAVATDVWTSMGQESEGDARRRAFEGWQVSPAVMAAAGPSAIFLHCLPAHRGEEVAADVIDGSSSQVWQQAQNRMHAARGLLLWLFGGGGSGPGGGDGA